MTANTPVPDPGEAFDLARLIVDAHCRAFHGGLLDDGCPECARLEAHEARAAFLYGMSVDPFLLAEMVA